MGWKAPYLCKKRGIFYINKRVPTDLISRYGRKVIRKSLGTRDRTFAIQLASDLHSQLEREWLLLRFGISESTPVTDGLFCNREREPVLSIACIDYCRMKGKLDDKKFRQLAERVTKEVIHLCGDKGISGYTPVDAKAFRDHLTKRGLKPISVKRNFAVIKSIWNLSAREYGLDQRNPFSNMNFGNGPEPKKCGSVPIDTIRHVQSLCREADDDMRWLIALLSDTGLRLSEAAGLHVNDVQLDSEIPHLNLREHVWRRLKTPSSRRLVPLVGNALWAVKRAISETQTDFLFPRYCSKSGCKSDYASNSLNKWLRPNVPAGCVVHSFRHSFRDRLRAVECPSDMIDQIGGWSSKSVGQSYGEGYPLSLIGNWMRKLEVPAG